MSKGSDFHKDGAITENARSPSEDKVRGTTSRCLSEERSARVGLWGARRFERYSGAMPLSDF